MEAKRAIAIAVVFLVPVMAVLSLRAQAPKAQARKVQEVKLSFDDKGYVVTPSTVTRGVAVKMEVDLSTVKGCMRTVVISAFDVKKTVKADDTTIEFTPNKTGEIQIICGMNMGKGKFTVVEPK
jgi:plastocyanin domain-containing protein